LDSPFCSICDTKLEADGDSFKCPKCNAVYHPHAEIMKHQEDVHFSHEDEQIELSGVSTETSSLAAADDETDGSIVDELYKKPRHKPNDGSGAASWDSNWD